MSSSASISVAGSVTIHIFHLSGPRCRDTLAVLMSLLLHLLIFGALPSHTPTFPLFLAPAYTPSPSCLTPSLRPTPPHPPVSLPPFDLHPLTLPFHSLHSTYTPSPSWRSHSLHSTYTPSPPSLPFPHLCIPCTPLFSHPTSGLPHHQ